MTVEEVGAPLAGAPATAGRVPLTGTRSLDREAAAPEDPPALLRPRPGGLAERFADRVGPSSPVRVFLAAVLSGYLLLAAAAIATGLAFTNLVLPLGGLERWDNDVNRWLADRRDATLVDASWVGSTLAGGHVIPIVVGVLLLLFAVRRRWLLAAFTLFAIGVESGTYRATTLVVARDRPPVDRLESLPVDASFPSGHTAASVALFGGLLLLCSSWISRPWFTALALTTSVAVVVFVGWSRMLRGMHHVTDTVAGIGIGVLAVVVTVFAARAATAAARRRRAAEAGS